MADRLFEGEEAVLHVMSFWTDAPEVPHPPPDLASYVLSPRISARTMELHPAVAFAAVIAGESVGGLAGAFLALRAAFKRQARRT